MNKRYEELDSLRGLAALFVLFSHIYLVIQGNILTKVLFEYSPLRLFISGGESVILFFLLSGFVLSLPYFDSRQTNYLPFLIKRICRIYIPYIVAIFVIIVCKEIFYTGTIKGLSIWFNSFWMYPISVQVVKDHVFLIGTFLSNLDPVIWSLVHEMRISIIFPFLMLIVVKLDWKKGIILSMLFSVIGVVLFKIFKSPDTGTEMVATINYTAMFIIGALLAKYRNYITNKFIIINSKLKLMIFSFGIIAYLFIHPSFVIKAFLFHNISPFYRTVIDSWAVSVGAVVIIIFALNSVTFSKILRIKFISFLGKISYSLYLIHVAILFASIQLLNNLLPMWSILLITLVGSLIVSSIMYYLIEKPAIKLGKFLTSKKSPMVNREGLKRTEKQFV